MSSAVAAASSSSSRPKPIKKKSKAISAPVAPVAAPAPASAATSSDEDEEPVRGTRSESSEIDEEPSERAASHGKASGNGFKKRKAYSAYQPPIGVEETRAPASFASSPFEWDALSKKEGVELWAIRVPLGMKPHRLSELIVHVPSRTTVDPHPSPRGELKTSKASYTLRAAASSSSVPHAPAPAAQPSLVDSRAMQVDPANVGHGARVAADLGEVVGARQEARREEAREEEIRDELMRSGGEEMAGLRLMLPRMGKEGDLFVAPKPISHHLILVPATDDALTPTSFSILGPTAPDPTLRPFPDFTSSQPAPLAPADSALANLPSREGKRAQPMDKLKRRNVPFGSGRSANNGADAVSTASDTAVRDADGDVTMGDVAADIDTPRKEKHKKHADRTDRTPTNGKKKHKGAVAA